MTDNSDYDRPRLRWHQKATWWPPSFLIIKVLNLLHQTNDRYQIHIKTTDLISGFCREAAENCAVLKVTDMFRQKYNTIFREYSMPRLKQSGCDKLFFTRFHTPLFLHCLCQLRTKVTTCTLKKPMLKIWLKHFLPSWIWFTQSKIIGIAFGSGQLKK